MVTKGKYKRKSQKQIQQSIKDMGFVPLLISNSAGYIYENHMHKETKVLAILEGSIKITVEDDVFDCKKGDEIIISGLTYHSAIVGKNGCEFYWAEKVI